MAEICKPEKTQLHVPDLQELRAGENFISDVQAKWQPHALNKYSVQNTVLLVAVLQAGLEDNFAEVQVSVVECPDLTKEPFHFPVKGKITFPKVSNFQSMNMSKILTVDMHRAKLPYILRAPVYCAKHAFEV